MPRASASDSGRFSNGCCSTTGKAIRSSPSAPRHSNGSSPTPTPRRSSHGGSDARFEAVFHCRLPGRPCRTIEERNRRLSASPSLATQPALVFTFPGDARQAAWPKSVQRLGQNRQPVIDCDRLHAEHLTCSCPVERHPDAGAAMRTGAPFLAVIVQPSTDADPSEIMNSELLRVAYCDGARYVTSMIILVFLVIRRRDDAEDSDGDRSRAGDHEDSVGP